MNGKLVQVDTRKRVSLGNMAHHSHYLAREEPDGSIVLEPAVVLTQAERAFLSNPELVETLREANAHPQRRRTRERARQ